MHSPRRGARPTSGASPIPITSTAASITSDRRSISRRSSSPSTGCTRWCRISSTTANGTAIRTRSQRKIRSSTRSAGAATDAMRERGLANWALSMGRQRAGALTLHNHPQFLQNLDVHAARRRAGQYRCRRARHHPRPRARRSALQRVSPAIWAEAAYELRRFHRSAAAARLARTRRAAALVATLRELYGQHRCDASNVITTAQLDDDGRPIDDCLGIPDGTLVDNIEDVDTVVGWLAESTRPHGLAISETQLQVFILNASRRLFSDRFFTSSFRPEFYTSLGIRWVTDNGPDGNSSSAASRTDTRWKCRRSSACCCAPFPSSPGARAGRQRVRSVGARPRRLLLAAMEAARRSARRIPRSASDGGVDYSGVSGYGSFPIGHAVSTPLRIAASASA